MEDREMRRVMAKDSLRGNWRLAKELPVGARVSEAEIAEEIHAVRRMADEQAGR